MAKRKDKRREIFKQAFDELALDGCIGDPNGREASAYLRVSSDEQAEEGHSGLPRQIAHCHEIAKQRGFRIPQELVFADDHSGFEFEDRPELSKLRQEYKNGKRTNVVVMEHIDRLSRNADWHQGYLLDEMRKHGVEPVFWQPFHSRVERAVMGAVSQDAMELAKARMQQGNINKAKSGRITSKKRAYGYVFVDSKGNVLVKPGRDTYYAIYEVEAPGVSYIFEQIALEGMKLRPLARQLDGLYPPPSGCRCWEPNMVANIIKNPVYKGEFAARRWKNDKVLRPTKDGLSTRYIRTTTERPREEWIIVPVPPIVSAALWEQANAVLQKNRQMSRRNAKDPYLLTSIVRCTCGYTCTGRSQFYTRTDGVKRVTRVYRCNRKCRGFSAMMTVNCKQGVISCRILDEAVWSVVSSLLLKPNILIDALDERYSNDGNAALLRQIDYLEEQIAGKALEDEKNRKAYHAGGYDEYEFAALRRQVKEEVRKLQAEKERVQGRVLTVEQVEAQKRFVLTMAEQARKKGGLTNASFADKQRVIKLMVDHIELNVKEQTFRLVGAIKGAYSIAGIASNSANTRDVSPSR